MPAGLGARSARGPGPGAGRAGGVEIPNGLLPTPRAGGRAPGRGPPGAAPGPAGGGVGRPGNAAGPGLGADDGGATVLSRLAAWALTAASCSALRATARASAAATSMSCADATLLGGGVGTGAFRGAAFGGAGFGVTFDAPLAAAGAAAAGAGAAGAAAAAIDSRRRRATGASTVLDADFTYSPRSCSLVRTVLLSTPSSFASSCTRALPATALLTPRPCGGCPLDLTRRLEACSFQELHRVLIWVVLPGWFAAGDVCAPPPACSA